MRRAVVLAVGVVAFATTWGSSPPALAAAGTIRDVRVLLHLVRPGLVASGEDRLSVAGALLERHRAVMRQHVRWAKAAGIDGFIVSWKNTHELNRRLATMARSRRRRTSSWASSTRAWTSTGTRCRRSGGHRSAAISPMSSRPCPVFDLFGSRW